MDGTLPGSRVKNIGQGDENLLLRIQVVDLCGHMETPDVHIAPGFSYGLMIVFVGFRTKISLKSQNGEVPWFDRFFLKETSFYWKVLGDVTGSIWKIRPQEAHFARPDT